MVSLTNIKLWLLPVLILTQTQLYYIAAVIEGHDAKAIHDPYLGRQLWNCFLSTDLTTNGSITAWLSWILGQNLKY